MLRVLEKESKIRKRGCSSSSSSSLVRHYRLKRAILVRKRCGSSTPVPTWKMGLGSKSQPGDGQNAKPKDLSAVSARKLGATLWEINDAASPRGDEEWGNLSEKGAVLVAERKVRPKAASHRRQISAVSQLDGFISNYNADITEIQSQHHHRTPSVHTRLENVSNGLVAAKELLKVWCRSWVHEEQRSSTISLISALRFELNQARLHVDHLMQERRSNGYEINCLVKLFSEEKAAWKSKEQDKIRNAITSIGEELKIEKKLRKQSERLNKKLGNELADTKASLSKVLNELQSEKRGREILEQVCDELARGIGEERDEIEEMKRESAKVREEVEKEREMLQLVDVLREERVQMKLLDAKYEFEEKNAAMERMKSELEAYLKTERGKEKSNNSPSFSKIKELEEYLWKTLGASIQTRERDEGKREFVDGEDDSADSDLHSIELNMDNKWGYSCDGVTPNGSKRNSVDGKIKGRKSFSEKTQRNIICLDRRKSDANEWDLGIHNSNGIDRVRLLELVSHNLSKDYKSEIETFEMVNDLRDHILSGANISSSQGFPKTQQV